MPERRPSGVLPLQVSFTDEQRSRIHHHAQLRDLSDASFVRLVVLGTLNQSTAIDRAINEAMRKGHGKDARRIGRPEVRHLWGHKPHDVGVWTWLADPQWRLVKPNPRSSRGADPENRSNWWFLINAKLDIHMPVAWTTEEAMRTAVEYIEQKKWIV